MILRPTIPAHAFVRARRRSLKIGVRQLSRIVECSAPHIVNIEKGHQIPSERLVVAIAEALDLDPDKLLLAFGRCPSDAIPRTIQEVELVRRSRMKGAKG